MIKCNTNAFMEQYINITFLWGDVVDCHPEETLWT